MAEETFVLLDDSEDDRVLMQIAFKRILPKGRLFALSTPDDIKAYLSGQKPYGDRSKYPFPLVLMIDHRLIAYEAGPGIIKWIRAQPRFNRLIIIMISGNVAPQVVDAAYDAGANSFLEKPLGLQELVDLMECVRKYWLECSRLPSCTTPDES